MQVTTLKYTHTKLENKCPPVRLVALVGRRWFNKLTQQVLCYFFAAAARKAATVFPIHLEKSLVSTLRIRGLIMPSCR